MELLTEQLEIFMINNGISMEFSQVFEHDAYKLRFSKGDKRTEVLVSRIDLIKANNVDFYTKYIIETLENSMNI